ncbi:MAG: hypothetical protein QW394_06465 [Thermofilaceae archaeon]
MARGISTVIGALLFLLVASLLLALALRAFNETVLALNEVANNQRAGVEHLGINVDYTAWKQSLASSVISRISVIKGVSPDTRPELLDYPDGNSIIIESEADTTTGSVTPASGWVELIKNGEFNDDFQYWIPSTGLCSWSIITVGGDKKARCFCRATGTGSGSAFIRQSFNLDFPAAMAVLSFEYSSSWTGDPLAFFLVVEVRRGGSPAWYWFVDLTAPGKKGGRLTLSLTGALTDPDLYTLNFSLFMAWKGTTDFEFTLDKVSLRASGQAPPPPQPTAYHRLWFVIDTVSTLPRFKGRLTVSTDATETIDLVFIELYRWRDGGWVLVEKGVVPAGSFYLDGFEGEGGTQFLVIAYSSEPFKLVLDYFEVTVLAPTHASVKVTNLGTEPVGVYAVWLRNSSWEKRIDVKRVLLPYDSLELSLDSYLTFNRLYEVRVVTGTRAHVVRFTTSGG